MGRRRSSAFSVLTASRSTRGRSWKRSRRSSNMAFDYDKYLRPGKLPHIWCPGCGHGIVMKGLIRAIDTLGLDKENTAIVSGIGCASRLPGYMDFCTLHTAHGRGA